MTDVKAGNGRARTKPARAKSPSSFTYTLKPWMVERRTQGWFVAETVPTFANSKVAWRGPFDTLEEAVRILSSLALGEVRHRHLQMIAAHNLRVGDPLYGLNALRRRKPAHA